MVILHQSQSQIHNLSPVDRALFYRFGIGEARESPFSCVHHAFEYHALRQPDTAAVIDFEERITYGELERQANCLAAHLRDMGVQPDSRVCVLVERSILMVVAILGVLKAGAAYIPLDGNIVSDTTLAHALGGSGSDIVLTLSKFITRVVGENVVNLENAICATSSAHCRKPKDLATTKGGAYVIYTSGTTGTPKGVDVSHRNVTNLLCLSPGNLHMEPGVRVSQLMNISFDMAAWEILGSMCNGSTLYLRGKTSKEWRTVMKLVDVVIATPSMLLPHNPRDYPNIKAVAVAGEPCPKSLADAWASHVKFYHCCGPTEVTIVNTMQLHSPDRALSIGKPIPNNNVYVLDPNTLEPLPIGTAGVMWAGGACVTRGYVNLPEKTAERYRPDPYAEKNGLMFNTGDLGRWNEDGTLTVLGRIDNQVKIKGFRVELDGVSSVMETFPGIHAATALLIDGELWGFVTPVVAKTEEIQAVVSKVQPYYAVPTRILHLDVFPKTANDKLDKRRLQELALESLQAESDDSTKSSVDGDSAPPSPPELKSPPPAYVSGPQSPSSERKSSSVTEVGSDISAIHKEEVAWAGYENDVIPEKTQRKYIRNLRHRVFSLYRRLFGIVFIINMGIFISLCVKGADAQRIGGIVIVNLFCAILMRQDYVINAFFNTCCAVPVSWPLAIRRVCARVYHIGGLHSGFAASGVVWLILFAGQATKQLLKHDKISAPTLTLTYMILVLLLGIVFLAYPTFRSKQHNKFEMAHRFLGWSATAMVWGQFTLLTNDYKGDEHLGRALVHAPHFWLLCILTCSIILPWIRLRKVSVRSEVLSRHAVRIYFDYTTPIPGSFARISDNPLFEWHGFATVPEPGKKGYSLVVSRAGDWTSKQIDNPPTALWVRGVPAFGVLRIVPLFRRLIFVATGSGIGPCAPCILEQRVPIRLLWTSPNVRGTFGDKLVDSILEKSPDAVIYDTRTHGKPDMVKLTFRLVKEFNAEAVCIISNQKLTEKVVYGMMSRGIPAFGAIWDS
ncbi:nonribosomal peptide synthetase 12 [Macrolepiota fuliginosa MF-IS2]|uniref:Nonribosomal peptide synthetase 12 n=1 Tax=Macrolepiota fuliginosa MF-IS2 TaxID=1400762 RepID=A0A9P5X6I3_9AGAR|nr:nonribosomal peptide synthetase 12 [Macrolepiota fuliginosa MF-IS2]